MKKFLAATVLATVATLAPAVTSPAHASGATVTTTNGYIPSSGCVRKAYSWSAPNKGTRTFDLYFYLYDGTGRRIDGGTQTHHTIFSGTVRMDVCSTDRAGTWTIRMDVRYLNRSYVEYVGLRESVRKTFRMSRR